MPQTKRTWAASALIDAMLRLMEHESVAKISITELCDAAGVTRTTFYRIFHSKEDVLSAWIRDVALEFMEKHALELRRDELRSYIVLLFQYLKTYAPSCKRIDNEGLSYLIADEFDATFSEVYEETLGTYNTAFLAGGLYHVYILWLHDGCKETPEQIGELIVPSVYPYTDTYNPQNMTL